MGNQMEDEVSGVGVLTPSIVEAGTIPLSNLIEILAVLSSRVTLISGDAGARAFRDDPRVVTYGLTHVRGATLPVRLFRFLLYQVRQSLTLARVTSEVDLWIFFFAADTQLLQMITAKLLGKRVVLAFTGSQIQTYSSFHDPMVLPVKVLSWLNCHLADRIVLYTPHLIEEYGLARYADKITVASRHFLDFARFREETPLAGRNLVIGYIGRLSEEKGVGNLLSAVPGILQALPGLQILFIGDGPLSGVIDRMVTNLGLSDSVLVTGWVPHDQLPEYLNQLALLILPSYTEGLPNVMLEAMACGTPVLATPVGSIPDLIVGNETGYLMGDNMPSTIVASVIRALDDPCRDTIAQAAREMVQREFSFGQAVARYRRLLGDVSGIGVSAERD